MKKITASLLLLVVLYFGYQKVASTNDWPAFKVNSTNTSISSNNGSIVIESTWLPDTAPSVHAATVIPTKDGNWRAFWFAGTREGAPDVVIQSSVFDSNTKEWSSPKPIIDREKTQASLLRYISKLGNPLPVRSPSGDLQLYFVAVSLGGWAGSSISMMESKDEGNTWTPPKRLITSPLINISNLVKSPALHFNDETIGLPSYHEFIGKFGELLQIDPKSGQIINKRRMSSGRESIQPVIFINNETNAIAYFRQTRNIGPAQIITSSTSNAGWSWIVGKDLNLSNPNSAIAGITLRNKVRLLVLNDLTEGRHRLSLMASKPNSAIQNDYSEWQTISIIEEELPKDGFLPEFSYPYIAQSSSGEIHLVYTWNRKRIRSILLSESGITQKLNSLTTNPSSSVDSTLGGK